MKKISIPAIIIVLAAIAISRTQKVYYSDITLANIEALAADESIYDYSQPKTVNCILYEGGGWVTGSVKRECVFCAVPSSCTPVECGKYF